MRGGRPEGDVAVGEIDALSAWRSLGIYVLEMLSLLQRPEILPDKRYRIQRCCVALPAFEIEIINLDIYVEVP